MHRHKNGWRVEWKHLGRRRTRKFGDIKLAERFEMELKLGIADEGLGKDLVPTFSDYAKRWVKDYCRVEMAESQWRKSERVIELHLEPAFGQVRLKHLRKSHLVDLKTVLRSKKQHGKTGALAPKSINLILALAKRIVATAAEVELVPSNPFLGVKLLKIPDRDFKYWLPAERETFLQVVAGIDPEFGTIVAVAAHTGLRLGEIAGLRKGDLDFERKRIRVSGSYSLSLEKRQPTKGREVADVPMNSAVMQALEPKRFLRDSESSVFPRELFKWSGFMCERLQVLAKAAGVPPIRFHDLRHTFASNLAMAGVDLMLIQKLLRHKSYQMTLRYAHLHPKHLEGATDVLVHTPKPHEASEEAKNGGPRGT